MWQGQAWDEFWALVPRGLKRGFRLFFYLLIAVRWCLVRKRQWNYIYLTIPNWQAGEELGLQLTRNEDNDLNVPVVNNKNTEELPCILKKATLFSSLKITEYSVSSQTPEILFLTIKCSYITHMLRDEFKEELRASGEFLSPNQTSWTWFFYSFTCKTCPGWAWECSKWEQGAPPAPQVCRAALREVFSSLGLSQHKFTIFYAWKCSVTAGTCSGVFVRQSQRVQSCWVIFCSFAAFWIWNLSSLGTERSEVLYTCSKISVYTQTIH